MKGHGQDGLTLTGMSAVLAVAFFLGSLATDVTGIAPSPLIGDAYADKKGQIPGGTTKQNVGKGTASKAGVDNANRLLGRNGRDNGGELKEKPMNLPKGTKGDDALFDRYCNVWSPVGGPSYDYEANCTVDTLSEIKEFCRQHADCHSAYLCNYSNGTIMAFDCRKWQRRGAPQG